MTTAAERLAANATNREVGFFVSESAKLTSENYTFGELLHPFSWIEAYFDADTLTDAELAIWDGVSYFDAPTNTVPLVEPVGFAYSGQPKNYRGIAIVESGKDYRGETITSSALADFSRIIVGGGARPAA
jgi:hypothetical protein